MAECLITAGWDCPDCDDKFSIPGVEHQEIWIANRSEIVSFGSVAAGEINAITFDALKGLKKLCVHKNTPMFTEELVQGENAGDHRAYR